MDKIFTSTDCANKEFNDDERSFVAYASKEVVDRDGEIIKTSAWQLKDFDKNPIIMLFHDHKTLPVGRAAWVKTTTDGLKFKPIFAKTETGKEVYQLYKEGILNAFSVGFMPMEWEDSDVKGVNRVYTKASLHEISCVNVPSCPEALVERIYNGEIKTKSLAKAFEEVIPAKEVAANGDDTNHDNPSYQAKDIEKVKDTEEKAISLGGLPSIRDIERKIELALSATPEGMSNVWVHDMFANTSTSGSCVIQFDDSINETRSKYWHYDYNYNMETETAILTNPVAVEEVFARKSIDKAGRELSGRNVTMLKGASTKMKDAAGMIDGLVEGKTIKVNRDNEEEYYDDEGVCYNTDPDIHKEDENEKNNTVGTEKEIQKDDTISIDDVKEILSTCLKDVTPLTQDDIKKIAKDVVKQKLGVLD